MVHNLQSIDLYWDTPWFLYYSQSTHIGTHYTTYRTVNVPILGHTMKQTHQDKPCYIHYNQYTHTYTNHDTYNTVNGPILGQTMLHKLQSMDPYWVLHIETHHARHTTVNVPKLVHTMVHTLQSMYPNWDTTYARVNAPHWDSPCYIHYGKCVHTGTHHATYTAVNVPKLGHTIVHKLL